MDWGLLSQLVLNGLIVGALYGVVAMSFVLIYKASQVVNFAQGEFLLVGAWVCWWLLTRWGLPFWAGFLLTLGFMTIFGVLLQVIVLRPLIGEPVISVIMATVGLSIFFQALMKWMFGVFAQPFPPIFSTERVDVLGLQVQSAYLLSLAISLVIMVAFGWFFAASKHGLAMRATAFDQQVAQSLGISVPRVFAMSWAISAVVSAVAGVTVGIVNGVSSGLSFYGIKVFPAVILGGLELDPGRRARRTHRRRPGKSGAVCGRTVSRLGQHVSDRAVLRADPDPHAPALWPVRYQGDRAGVSR